MSPDGDEIVRLIVETTPECIKVVAADGRLLQMNPAGLRMVEADDWSDVAGACTFDLVADEHRDTWLRNHGRVCRGENLIWEFDIIGLKGARRRMQTHAAPIVLSDGSTGQLGITRDITSQKRLDEELEDAHNLLEAKVAQRTQELKDALTRLQESERNFGLLVDSVTDYALYMLDPDGKVVSWNAGAQRIKGYSAEEIIGEHFSRFYTDEDKAAGLPARGLATAAREGRFEAESWRQRKDGSRFWANVVIDAIRDGGKLVGFAKITRDITERKAAEALLHQAQKMEAVGQLTGGVAHDFNNLLAAIIPSLEMARMRVQDEKALRHLDIAARAAERGGALTHQLLAFSRKQHLASRPVDVNPLIEQLCDMLPRTLGPTISIERDLDPDAWPAMTDPSQLDVALLNLAINARDAMPGGGVLSISTRNVDLGQKAGPAELEPGAYVLIGVSDTGTGMSEATQQRAFEPFFSTKIDGRGSGLGLSMVYGFARQSGGQVVIDSEPGRGATIRIYLPRATEAAAAVFPPIRMDSSSAGPPSRLLIVDDDDAVRGVTTELVRGLGHEVVEAASGDAALEILRRGPGFHLMVVDLAMPNMHGAVFAVRAREIAPTTPVLFVTGYSEAIWAPEVPGDELLKKPFTQTEIAAKLRAMLPRGAAAEGPSPG